MKRVQVTTTIDETLLKLAKIECINKGIKLNDFMEVLFKTYFKHELEG